MAAEDESLTLRVSLDDQASAQLAALRGQLDQMRGMGAATAQVQAAAPQIAQAIGAAVDQLTEMAKQLGQLPTQITAAMSATVQGLQQVQTQLTQVSTQIQQSAQAVAGIPGRVKAGSEGLTTAIRQAGFLGGIAGGATAELVNQLTKLGSNLIDRATDFHGLADSMKDLQTHAEGVGRTMTGYQGLQRQLQLGGMTPKQSQEEISRAADLSLELKQYGAENSPTYRRLTQDTNPATTKAIYDTLKQMEGAPLEEQINLWIKLKENIRETMTLAGNPEGFEAAWAQISERAGKGSEAFENLEKGFRARREPPDPVRDQMFRDRARETAQFTKDSLYASFYWKDIGQSLAASAVHGLEVTGAAGELNTWLLRIRTDAEAFERVWRETDFKTALEELKKLDPVIAPYVEQVKQLAEGLKATANTTLEEFKAILPILHTINDVLGKLGLGPPKPLAPEGTPEREQQDREAEQGTGFAGAGYAHRFLLRRGLISPRKDEQIPPSENVEPKPETPETSALAPWRRLLDYNRRMREAERKELERTGTAAPSDFLKGVPDYNDQPDETPAPFVGPTLEQARPPVPPMMDRFRGLLHRSAYEGEGDGAPIVIPAGMLEAQARAREQGGGRPIPPDVMQALIKSAQPEVGGQPSGLHEGVQLAGYKSRIAGEMVNQFKTPGNLLKTGTDLGEMAKAGFEPQMPTAMGALLSILPLGLGEIPDLLKKDAEAGSPFRAWMRNKLGIEDPNEPPVWEKGGAWHPDQNEAAGFDQRFGAWHQGQDEAADQKEGFDKRFGIWPSMGADKLNSTSSKLDQAANTNVNISGAGKIKVDVSAPPGTSVSAETEGFFKSSELTRLTQMYPADMGPLPMTGVGTGQGPSGNGTVS